MKSKKPLRYAVSSALLVGSLSACGGNSPPPNEPQPEVNEAHESEHHDPETNEVAVEEAEPVEEVHLNEPAPQPTVNEIPDEE